MNNPKCGLVSISANQPGTVPLKKIDTRVSIYGFIANVKSDLHYVNEADESIETDFVFPLDSDAAVYKLEAEIDGRTIVAEVQEKSQAKVTYVDAVESGLTAVYMSEDDDAGDIFRVRVGNLPAKMAAKLTFSYVQELALRCDQTGTFMLPMVLNPRYTPDCTPTDQPNDEETEVSNSLENQVKPTMTSLSEVGAVCYSDLTVNLAVEVAGGKNLMMSENKMEFDVLAAIIGNKMSTSKQLKPGSDFSIVLNYKGFEKPGALLEKGKTDGGAFLSSDVLMVNFVPEIEEADRNMPCEFVFVIDRSCSMRGERIEKAKETLLLLLKSLPVNCIFNVVSFGTKFSSLFSKSQPYTESTLKKALSLQESMTAEMGGTEIFKPLESVFKNKSSDSYARQIFLLTDGQVNNVKKIVDLVQKQKNTRVFTFGIGDGCSTELVKDVARVSNGKATFVKDNDRLQSKVMYVLRCSMTHGISDVSLQWSLPKECCVINIPEQVPAIFPGEKTILYAVLSGDIPKDYSDKNSLKLIGKAGNKSVEFSFEFDFNSDTCSGVDFSFPLHRLAAKTKLSEMELQRITDTIVTTLSVEVNIPCKHTAFVGVDKDNKLVVPLLRPKYMIACCFCGDSAEELKSSSLSSDVQSFQRKASYGFSGSTTRARSSTSSRSIGLGKRISNVFNGSGFFAKKKPEAKRNLWTSNEVKNSGLDSHMDQHLDMDEDEFDRGSDSKSAEGHPLSKMVQLIEKQKFDGSWTLDEGLCGILNTGLQKIKDAAVVKDLDVWTTAIIIAVFRKEFDQHRSEWKLIEEKALKWLKTKDLEGEDVVQEAMTFLTT